MTAVQERKEEPMTFEQIREMFQEIGRKQEVTGRQMKETDKRLGALTNRFGEVVEYMIVPSLNEKFNELGYTFGKTAPEWQAVRLLKVFMRLLLKPTHGAPSRR
jgi:hypothetical protein